MERCGLFAQATVEASYAPLFFYWDKCRQRGVKGKDLYDTVERRIRSFGYCGPITFKAYKAIGRRIKCGRRMSESGITFYKTEHDGENAADDYLILHIDQYFGKKGCCWTCCAYSHWEDHIYTRVMRALQFKDNH